MGSRTVLTISPLSTEYVRVPVFAKVDGVSVDVTLATVSMAAVGPTATPSSGDWISASWDYDESRDISSVQALFGPGGQSLSSGRHSLWVRIVATPETVIRRVGTLVVE